MWQGTTTTSSRFPAFPKDPIANFTILFLCQYPSVFWHAQPSCSDSFANVVFGDGLKSRPELGMPNSEVLLLPNCWQLQVFPPKPKRKIKTSKLGLNFISIFILHQTILLPILYFNNLQCLSQCRKGSAKYLQFLTKHLWIRKGLLLRPAGEHMPVTTKPQRSKQLRTARS